MKWAILPLCFASYVAAQVASSSSSGPASCTIKATPSQFADKDFKSTSPPKYPTPIGGGHEVDGSWKAAYEKAKAKVAEMTLIEKVNVTTGTGWQSEECVGSTGGVSRLDIPGFCMQDSPLGVRFGQYSSAFPAGVTIAATWNRALFRQRGAAMGLEHKMKGVTVQLGPVSGPLGRFAEGGRNWEGGGSDPYLSGVGLAEATIGIQSQGVIACAKHYIANEQEHFRQAGEGCILTNESISSNVDDRTMHEVYLWPFADAVRAGVGSVMCSYNLINNSYGCQNSKLLNGLLKDELDFQGFVMSDWGAHHSGVGAALAGLDMSMPGDKKFLSYDSFWGGNLTVSVLNGSIPEWRLNDMATRILAAWYYVGADKNFIPVNFASWTTDVNTYENYFAREGYGTINKNVDVRYQNAALIRRIGAEGSVLLKNEKGTLPLKSPRQIAVFGSDAGDNPLGPNGCNDRGCASGTVAMGWGSGTANFPYLISPLTALQNRALRDNSIIQWVTDDYAKNLSYTSVASQATVCLAFVKADAGEGYIIVDGNQGDRNNLTLWANGDFVIKQVASVCNNTVVVVHAPGPVLMEDWIENPNVTAVVYAGLPGQESGNSIVDVLYGDIVPSGKLPFTIAKNASDYGTKLMYVPNNFNTPQQEFDNGLLIDHRYFDKNNIEPRFEFGFGLSYATFEYSNLVVQNVGAGPYVVFNGMTEGAPPSNNGSLGNASDYLFPEGFHKIKGYVYPYLNSTSDPGLDGSGEKGPTDGYLTDPQKVSEAGGAPGGNPSLYDVLYHATVTITNTGKCSGQEVVQLYVSTGEDDSPVRVLRGFEKVSIEPGQSTTVILHLLRRDLSIWDINTQNWNVTSAPKTVFVGPSSRNLPLNATLS